MISLLSRVIIFDREAENSPGDISASHQPGVGPDGLKARSLRADTV